MLKNVNFTICLQYLLKFDKLSKIDRASKRSVIHKHGSLMPVVPR